MTDKPNHYYHDSLGCPYECPEDHNHPVPVTEETQSE